jgi:hypothetical protein
MSSRIEIIRHLFGNSTASGYALDARDPSTPEKPKAVNTRSKTDILANPEKVPPKPKPKKSTAKWAESMSARPSRLTDGVTPQAETKAEPAPKPTANTSKSATPQAKSPTKASPSAFHSELKQLNDHASISTSYFNELLGKRLGVKIPKGASISKAIERLKKTHSEADIQSAAQAIANENTRTR